MPAVSAAVPFACPACRRLLLSRPHLRTRSLHCANQFRNFAVKPPTPLSRTRDRLHEGANSSQPAQDPNTSSNDRKPWQSKPQIWTSYLGRQQTMGKMSEVLVMRDVERKKLRAESREEEQRHKDADQTVTVEKMLSSLRRANLDAAQDDAQQTISSLRPSPRILENRPPSISKLQFEETLTALVNGFNQNQLGRYINAQKRNNGDIEVTNMGPWPLGETIKSQALNISPWVSAAHQSKSTVYRGKRALANNIIRSVWGFEVSEEVDVLGILEVQANPILLSLIFSGDTSPLLSELSKSKNVKIDLDRSTGRVILTADKYKCLEAAQEIERFLQNVHTVELDIGLFRSLSPGTLSTLESKDWIHVAGKYSCSLADMGPEHKIIIRAGSQVDADRCQRALVAMHWDLLYRSEAITDVHGEITAEGSISTFPFSPKSIPFGRRDKILGRFTTPFYVAGGWEHASKGDLRLPRLLLDDDKGQISQRLLQISHPNFSKTPLEDSKTDSAMLHQLNSPSARWKSQAYSETSAEPGQFLHPASHKPMSQSVTAGNLVDENASPTFVHTLIGLPQFLYSNFHDSRPTQRDGLNILLVPSPWALGSLSDQQAYPPLEMKLAVDFTTRKISVGSLRAVLRHRTLNLLLPHLGTDVRFHSRQLVECENANDIPQVEAFLKVIQSTASGYGKIAPPLTLDLDIPAWLIESASGDGASLGSCREDSVRVQYFATGIEYEESLVHPNFHGAEFALRQIGGGEFGITYQGMQLQCPDVTALSSLSGPRLRELYGDAPHSTEAIMKGFVGATSLLLKDLNQAIGNMRMEVTAPYLNKEIRSTQGGRFNSTTKAISNR